MDIEKLAREAGLAAYPDEIQRFADLVRRETAKEAAKLCDEIAAPYMTEKRRAIQQCSSAIRERFKA